MSSRRQQIDSRKIIIIKRASEGFWEKQNSQQCEIIKNRYFGIIAARNSFFLHNSINLFVSSSGETFQFVRWWWKLKKAFHKLINWKINARTAPICVCVFAEDSRLKFCLTNGLTSGWDFNYLFFSPSSPLIEFSSPFSVALCMMMIWRSCAQNISFTSNEKWKSTELIKLFNWQSSRCCESEGDFSMWIRLNFFISFNFYIQNARHEQLRAYEASRKIKKHNNTSNWN